MSQAQERVLWNIYGNRYDLTSFLDKHPGGRKILELSRSDKDLTPLFESYHSLSNIDILKKMLDKYYVDDNGAPVEYLFNSDGFYYTLKNKINNYFKKKNQTHKVNLSWFIKTSVMIIAFLFFYLKAFVFNYTNLISTCIFAFLSGMIIIMIGFSVMHDASHYALFFKKPRINEFLSNLINSFFIWNSDLWLLHHSINHHAYTGDPKKDPDLLYTQPIVRKSINISKNKYWKISNSLLPYLTYFFLFVFPGFYFGSILIYSFIWQFRGYIWRIKFPEDYKTNYISNFINLLAILPHFYRFNIFISMSYIIAANITYGICILPDHDTFETTQNHINLNSDWGEIQVRNSGNFENGRFNDLFCYLFGGINYQIEHHLFPSICHVHYPSISKIVKETCHDFNIPYVSHPTLYSALKDFTKSIISINSEKEKAK